MSAKAYLSRVRKLSNGIRALKRKIEELESLKTGIGSPALDSDPVQTSKEGEANFTRTIEQIMEAEELMAIRIGEYADTIAEIDEEIRRLENPIYAEVLSRRYLEFQRYERIAVDMHYSFDYVKQLHGKALRAFEERYPEIFIE